VVEQIEHIVEEKVEAKKDILATKTDLGLLKEDLLNVRNELSEKIHFTERTMIFGILGLVLYRQERFRGFYISCLEIKPIELWYLLLFG
jgi:hypothetical protein